jgi:PAS domain S-box-containing protein
MAPISLNWSRRRPWRHPSFSIIAFALTVIALTVAYTAWEIHDDWRNTLREADNTTQMAVDALREHTSEAFIDATSPMWSTAQTIRAAGGPQALSDEQVHRILKLQTPPGTPLDRLFLVDTNGDIVASSLQANPPTRRGFRGHPAIASHIKGQTATQILIAPPMQLPTEAIMTESMKQPGNSTWVIPITQAIRDRDGNLQGIVGALFSVDYFKNFYTALGSRRDATIVLMHENGTLLARHPFRPEYLGVTNLAALGVLQEMRARGDLPIVRSKIDNVERLVAWRQVEKLPLMVYVGLSVDDVLAGWRTRVERRAIVASLFSLVVIVLSAMLTRKLAALSDSERRYRVLFESATLGILLLENNIVVDANAEATALFRRLSPEALSGLDAAALLGPEVADRIRTFAARAEETAETEDQFFECKLQARDGSSFWASITLSIFGAGSRHFVLAMLRDVSARKEAEAALQWANQELEDRVADRTAQLAQVNDDLQAFNYSASHDLRAPIRRIRSFIELLEADYEGRIPTEAERIIGRIGANATRMDDLLNNLLHLFSTNQSPLEPKMVDLGDMTRSIIAELASDQPERHYELDVAASLRVWGDEGLLRLALTNLLSNAWKFSAQRDWSRFEVGRRGEAYFVRDNGVGFEDAYKDKIFVAFHRLHTDGEFEGTGIGLAIVKRVVERHGGRIWGESKLGEGATFYFTLGSAETIERLRHTR